MARLPGMTHVIQQAGGIVRLFEDGSEALVVVFDPADGIAVQQALDAIRASDRLTPEDQCFALFWAGYFHAYADRDPEVPGEVYITVDADLNVLVLDGTPGTEAVVVRFDPRDANAAARAQKNIYDSRLSQHEKDRAHFWSGFHYGQASGG